jgi:2-hydroxy-3-keto-5-methylthiopentenyl-1-phosphate phosphatase
MFLFKLPRKNDELMTFALSLFSSFGHDKSREIRPYASLSEDKRPVLFYAGDGVSDLSAAKETDLLFAKAGRGKTYCSSSRGA